MVNLAVVKELESGSMYIVQLAIVKVFNVVHVDVHGLVDLTRAALVEIELFASMEVRVDYINEVAISEIWKLILECCGSSLLPMLGQGGLYAQNLDLRTAPPALQHSVRTHTGPR